MTSATVQAEQNSLQLRNDEVVWDTFDPDAYWHHNYRRLRSDDRAIIQAVGEFFSAHFRDNPSTVAGLGIDVGSGANLYPALAMLPWCSKVVLTDLSTANVAWLRRHATYDPETDCDEWPWQPFWDAYSVIAGYRLEADARRLLASRHTVRQQSIFALDKQEYDQGTMFFVAESMTSDETEFEDATEHFIAALRPGAPFAAAFMHGSMGYSVAKEFYPAVKEITVSRIEQLLSRLGASAQVRKIDPPVDDPLRDGYQGMIIAVGLTAPT